MKRRYLEARYDVTGLSDAEADVLAGEATAMAEASDRGPDAVDHPDVPVELDYTTIEVCRDCGKEIPEGDDICDSCKPQRLYEPPGRAVVSLSGADILSVEAPHGQVVEVRQYHVEYRDDEASVEGGTSGGRYQVVWPA